MNIILLPSHNEEKAIGLCINEIRRYTDAEIVVVLSGCTDGTDKIARAKDCVRIDAPKGKGNAVRFALDTLMADAKRFKQLQFDNLLMMDSDFTYPAKYIPQMFAKLKDYDVVYGHRIEAEGQMFDPNWKWGNQFVSWYASILYQHRTKDLLTGMWAFKKEALDTLSLKSSGFTLEAELFTALAKSRASVGVVPISYRPRLEGDRPKIHRLDHLKIMWFLLFHRFTNA
jgi:dolichol-phosphate mannosyltransferase